MPRIRLTKEFSFETAHALFGYDGKCRELHGHSYKFMVTVIGEPSREENSSKYGMVMDFGDLKSIVNSSVVNRLDHALVIRKCKESECVRDVLKGSFSSIIEVDYQPTCENMLSDFAQCISSQLPSGVKLHSLRLHETANSFAEWYASDQV